ncbi:MAG TPA: ferritin family protein, partial [Burkholderiales bacterium]|nr:ferritin family protein [Burkholderiales bacterium]
MKALKGTRTHENLKAAFAGESQANRRYLYFAAKADVEGHSVSSTCPTCAPCRSTRSM